MITVRLPFAKRKERKGEVNAIIENLVGPLVRRLGTAAAMWLLAKGLDSSLVEQLVNGLTAAALIGVDLLLARFYRTAVVSKVLGFRDREGA